MESMPNPPNSAAAAAPGLAASTVEHRLEQRDHHSYYVDCVSRQRQISAGLQRLCADTRSTRAPPPWLHPGADGSALRRGELPDQPLLDAVLLEAERLYPPLLFAMRGTRADIEYDGYHIPAHTKVAYSPYYTGRMPELFPDPLRFDPRRFLGKKPQPYTLLGFGGGHRVCIGKRFAGLEMRLFLNLLLGRFELTPQPQDLTAVFFNPTLQRKHGYWVTLRPRPGADPVQAA